MLKAIRSFFKFICLLILIVVLLGGGAVGYACFVEPRLLSETELQESNAHIKKELTVAIFADTHFGPDYTLEDFQKLINKVNENPPDILLFGGDLIDDLGRYAGTTDAISQALSQMEANIGKYAVFGNHDYGGGAEWEYKDIMKAGGFQTLKNKTVSFDQYGLRILGIDDLVIGYGNPQIALAADDSKYNLVLCHEPDVADDLAGSFINFMLAGHTHGGQIRIPFYKNQYLPSFGERYTKGRYTIDRMSLYVVCGVGTTKIPARFLAPPELTYLTLSPKL